MFHRKTLTGNGDQQLESPTSTVTFSENLPLMIMPLGIPTENINRNSRENNNESSEIPPAMIEFPVSSSTSSDVTLVKEHEHDWMRQINCPTEEIEEGFTSLLLGDSNGRSFTTGKNDVAGAVVVNENDYNYYEDNKNYWNSILNLVDSSPSDSPTMF